MKCMLLVLCFASAGWGLSIRREIPVEILYEQEPHQQSENGIKNLDVKIQLPDYQQEENKPLTHGNPNGVKNLAEKNQLSEEELTLTQSALKNIEPINDNSLGDLMILRKAEEMINEGLNSLKLGANKISSIVTPNEDSWKQLNKSVQDYFHEQYKQTGLKDDTKQDNNNNNQIIQNIVNQLQNWTGNFVQSFQQFNQQNVNKPINGTEDEGTSPPAPGFGQNFINAFNGGVQQIVNNLQSLSGQQSTTSSTVLGDTGTGTTTQGTSIFNNVFTAFQQIVSGGNSGNPPQSATVNQSDTGVGQPTTGSQGGPAQIFQSISNQISNGFNNVFGQGTTIKPEDAGTGGGSGSQGGFFQSVGSAIQSVFNPQASGGSQSNPITQGAQSVGNQIQQAVGGTKPSGAETMPADTIQNALTGVSTEKSKNPVKVEDEPVEKPVATEVPVSVENKPSDKKETMETTE